jgi:hypothetical protein
MRKFSIQPVRELRHVLIRQRHVLDDEALIKTRSVQGVVHDSRVHEVIGEPADWADEGETEISVGEATCPECAAVVAEKV